MILLEQNDIKNIKKNFREVPSIIVKDFKRKIPNLSDILKYIKKNKNRIVFYSDKNKYGHDIFIWEISEDLLIECHMFLEMTAPNIYWKGHRDRSTSLGTQGNIILQEIFKYNNYELKNPVSFKNNLEYINYLILNLNNRKKDFSKHIMTQRDINEELDYFRAYKSKIDREEKQLNKIINFFNSIKEKDEFMKNEPLIKEIISENIRKMQKIIYNKQMEFYKLKIKSKCNIFD